jgi:hypothetical protein
MVLILSKWAPKKTAPPPSSPPQVMDLILKHSNEAIQQRALGQDF